MTDVGEFRFRIGRYTPETLPMARLADYLYQLATLFGDKQAVHFVTVEAGSAVPLIRVDEEALPGVHDRLEAVSRGEGPFDAMRAYRKINDRLRVDDTNATLTGTEGVDILLFPGRDDDDDGFRNIRQPSSIDGEIVRVGGQGNDARIIMRAADDVMTDIAASKPVAKALARHLFETVRLHGTGRWTRSREGGWILESFRIDRFEILLDEALTRSLTATSLLQSRWDEVSGGDLLVLRSDGIDE